MDLITPDVLTIMRMVDHAERGIFPVSGGVLDQAQCFLNAMEFVRRETAKNENAKRQHVGADED